MPKKSATAQPPSPFTPAAAIRNGNQKKPLLRSPNHPVLGLEKAIELVTALQGTYGTHEVPAKMAHELWGYEEGSAIGDQCVAALKSYGLIGVSGKGDDRKVAITADGGRIARNAPDRAALIRKAAMAPAIHQEIVKHYGAKGIPSDNGLLKQYLVWERPEGSRFNEKTVAAFINRFRKALEFSGATASDIIDQSPDEEDKENGGDPPPPPHQTSMAALSGNVR